MLTEEQKQAILEEALVDSLSDLLPAWRRPVRKKLTTAQRKKRKAARKRYTVSQAKNKPKKLSRRKKGKKLHLRKRRNRK